MSILKTPICLLLLLLTFAASAQPVDTRFTYQGELQVLDGSPNPIPANGEFDFVFTLFDSELAGTALGTPFNIDDVNVIDGIFSVEMDFGVEPYTGDQLWLQIEVRNGADNGIFTELSPRQILTAAPFAILAELVSEGSVGQAEVVASEVQLRIDGSCPAGSFMRVINEDGSVVCETDSDEQNLSLSGTSISISNGNSVDIAPILDDNDATNELNTAVSFDGTNLTVSDAGGNLSADLSPLANDDDNELNTGISFSGSTLTISDAGGDQSVTLTGIVNNDTNELNTGLSLSGNNLSVTDAGGSLTADLSSLLDNTDSQTLSLSDTSISISGGNAVDLAVLFNDNDPTNELNTNVNFDGINLNITDAGGTLSTDLSALSDTAAQALAKLLTVDGANSGLDADLLDGMQASEIIAAANTETRIPINSLPLTITTPGSYIVTQNLVDTVDDTNGIRVEVSNVTIDLGGFRLIADMSPDDNIVSGRNGIFVANGINNIHILNGHIDDWGARGIDASNCIGCIFENLTLTNNRFEGMESGQSAVISHVTSSFNGDDGFELGSSTVVFASTAQSNGENGFEALPVGSAGQGVSIINSSAFENGFDGFELEDAATVISCSAHDNLQHGFELNGSSTVQESTAYDNGFNGFDVVSSMLRDNVAAQNGSLATSPDNDNGFRVSSDSYLINNHAYENDGAGIRVASNDVTIENNTAIDNDRAGIESRVGDSGGASTQSLYIRNRAAGNATANFDIAAGNSFGPIVNIASSGDISTVANANHPMANFEY